MNSDSPDVSTPIDSLFLTVDELAASMRVSKRHLSLMNATGRVPKPVKLGRRTVWPTDEIRAWAAQGAPSRSQWETMRKGGAK